MDFALDNCARFLQRVIYPAHCLLCGAGKTSGAIPICAPCAEELPVLTSACQRCALPLRQNAARCGSCLRRPPRQHATTCAYRYAYPIDHMIRALKFGRDLAMARTLGELLAQRLKEGIEPESFDAIVPMPLAPTRFAERGFNQSTELAKCLSRALHVPVRTDVLARTRETQPQATLPREARRKNVHGAFIAQGHPRQRLLLIDDVITTGHTVSEAARALRRASATHVHVCAIARADFS